ncbi:MAG TPA: hypothetical protein VJM80_10995 [bacterium]|nr:hypothetical protein [bacterium]
MGKDQVTTVEVICPCCQAKLIIDPSLKAVLSHEPPPKASAVTDLTEAVQALKGKASEREARFLQSVEAEKEKGKVLERKFQEAFKKAKDEPITRTPRPFDFD